MAAAKAPQNQFEELIDGIESSFKVIILKIIY